MVVLESKSKIFKNITVLRTVQRYAHDRVANHTNPQHVYRGHRVLLMTNCMSSCVRKCSMEIGVSRNMGRTNG